MDNLDYQSLDLYVEYINKELYRSRFTINNSYNLSKLVLINKASKSSYWFPAYAGKNLPPKPNKLRLKKHYTRHSVSNFVGFDFLPTFEVFFSSYYFGLSINGVLESQIFRDYLVLANESVRKQELKKHSPRVKWLTFNI